MVVGVRHARSDSQSVHDPIHKIVDTFTRLAEIPRYSRMVPLAEITDPNNDFNPMLRRLTSVPPRRHALDRDPTRASLGQVPTAEPDDVERSSSKLTLRRRPEDSRSQHSMLG